MPLYALAVLPTLEQLQRVWGTGWVDHLRLLLPVGVVIMLLAKFYLRFRQRLDVSGPLVLYAPTYPAASLPTVPSNPPPSRPTVPAHPEPPRTMAPPPSPRGTFGPLKQPEPAVSFPSPSDDSHTIRFVVNDASPMEFLPGRLEIVEGLPLDQEFRFQRMTGGEVPEVTLGRASGPSYRHIQLSAPTVSRIHARLRFESDRWVILNLSEANPLCIHGRPLTEPHVLVDGDELQVGEVLLRYHDGRR